MASPLCFVLFVVTLGMSVKIDLTLADDLSDCNEFEYKLNGDTKCRQCPACPAGQMYTVNCGYTEVNGVIKRPNKGCKDCPPHHYKTQKSPYQCEQCTNRCPEGTRMIHPCNKTHDLKCTKCKKGFYTASDGSCVRCSICCGKPSIYGNQYVEHECESAGMGTCSCRPLQGCVDKDGACKKSSTAVPLQHNVVNSTAASMTTTARTTKTPHHFKLKRKLLAKENESIECRNKAVLRRLREILSKYKRRVVVKISIEVKDKKDRKVRTKGRSILRRMKSRDY